MSASKGMRKVPCKDGINTRGGGEMPTYEMERYIQNKDIREMRGCCAGTACKIIKMIKETYGIKDNELPYKHSIPLSVYEYHYRKKSPNEWAKRKQA